MCGVLARGLGDYDHRIQLLGRGTPALSGKAYVCCPTHGHITFLQHLSAFMMRIPGEISSQAHKLSFLLSLFVISFSFFSRLKAQAGMPAIADKHVGAAASHASLKNLRCYRFGRTDSL